MILAMISIRLEFHVYYTAAFKIVILLSNMQFEMAKEYLKPTFGGTIIDASCGSGLFSRLFSKNRIYSLVVALDFSENMLRQCNDFVEQEGLSREYDYPSIKFPFLGHPYI